MFKRRNPISWQTRVGSWFWPTIGWNRYAHYLAYRLSRLGGTPYSIAAGTACGIAISFTPFVGFHFLLAALTAWIIKANILASAIGTAAGNPWTFPFIWISVLHTGQWFLGQEEAVKVEFTQVFEKAVEAIWSLDFTTFFGDVWSVVFPMMVGCIPYYIVVWTISFCLLKKVIEKIEQKRKSRKIRL